MRLTLPEIKKKVAGLVPKGIDYEVDLEAGSIAIITDHPNAFAVRSDNLTVRIAKSIKRRIVVRPHPGMLSSETEVHDAVNRIMPP